MTKQRAGWSVQTGREQRMADEEQTPEELRRRVAELEAELKHYRLLLRQVGADMVPPATSVEAFADILLRNRDGNLTERQVQYVEVIRRYSRILRHRAFELTDSVALSTLRSWINPIDVHLLALEVVHSDVYDHWRMAELLDRPTRGLVSLSRSGEIPEMPVDREAIKRSLDGLIRRLKRGADSAFRVEIVLRYDPADEMARFTVSGALPGDSLAGPAGNLFADVDWRYDRPDYGWGLETISRVAQMHGGELGWSVQSDGHAEITFSVSANTPLTPPP